MLYIFCVCVCFKTDFIFMNIHLPRKIGIDGFKQTQILSVSPLGLLDWVYTWLSKCYIICMSIFFYYLIDGYVHKRCELKYLLAVDLCGASLIFSSVISRSLLIRGFMWAFLQFWCVTYVSICMGFLCTSVRWVCMWLYAFVCLVCFVQHRKEYLLTTCTRYVQYLYRYSTYLLE